MLYVVATPIGNLEDISLRAIRVLKEADIIACEDTRQTIKLSAEFGLKASLVSYHQHSKVSKIDFLLAQLKKGKNIALVCDGGTPGISDPGFHLLDAVIKENIEYTYLPGPAACIGGLVLSGLPMDGFLFLGFIPKKKGKIKKALQKAAEAGKTVVFYESPYRLAGTLQLLKELFGESIKVAVAREMTKKFEEVIRGDINGVLEKTASKKILGEVTVAFHKI